jgi:hypothetical protein
MAMNYDQDALARMYNSAGKLQATQIKNQYKLGKDEIKARLKIASQSSKDTRYGIEQERDAARERVAQMREEMERIGIPQMEINRFVAESTAYIAREELGLKREIFLAESGLARDQLAKDIREMEEIGIPRVEIERYAAEKQAELGQLEYTLKRDAFVEEQRQFGVNFEEARRQYDTTHAEEARQFNVTTGEAARQFNVGASGYMEQGGTLTAAEQARMADLETAQRLGTATPGDLDQLYRYRDVLSGVAGVAGGGGRQNTLARDEFQQTQLEQARRYGLDVAQFGATLASTPDTYFQARRFQGLDVPRLLGGAGAATTGPTGGPTPGVATMGAYLSGQDPYAQAGGAAPSGAGPSYPAGTTSPYGGPQAGAAQPAPPGTLGMPGTPEDDRYKQIQQIAKVSPPSPFDGLNEQDSNTLGLMAAIYKRGGQGIAGGEYERLAASGRLGYLQSAGRVLGYDPKELESQYQSYRPAQQSASLAG